MRTNHIMRSNCGQIAALWEAVEKEKLFNRVSVTRWSVPIDDTNSWIFGYRHFNDVVDTAGIGKEEECGIYTVDFLGQTRNRSYEERQREPGDWDALVGQRPIAIHDLEHLGTTDKGVTHVAAAPAGRCSRRGNILGQVRGLGLCGRSRAHVYA